MRGDRAARPEVAIDRGRVEKNRLALARYLDDDVELRREVVDDGEADAILMDARRNLPVRTGGFENP